MWICVYLSVWYVRDALRKPLRKSFCDDKLSVKEPCGVDGSGSLVFRARQLGFQIPVLPFNFGVFLFFQGLEFGFELCDAIG
jgi:hypothetical protein